MNFRGKIFVIALGTVWNPHNLLFPVIRQNAILPKRPLFPYPEHTHIQTHTQTHHTHTHTHTHPIDNNFNYPGYAE